MSAIAGTQVLSSALPLFLGAVGTVAGAVGVGTARAMCFPPFCVEDTMSCLLLEPICWTFCWFFVSAL